MDNSFWWFYASIVFFITILSFILSTKKDYDMTTFIIIITVVVLYGLIESYVFPENDSIAKIQVRSIIGISCALFLLLLKNDKMSSLFLAENFIPNKIKLLFLYFKENIIPKNTYIEYSLIGTSAHFLTSVLTQFLWPINKLK